MATATVHAASTTRLPRWTVVSLYLLVLVVAEILIAIPGPSPSNLYPFQEYGLTVHILLVFVLLFHAVLTQDKDPVLSSFLVALTLAPLIRIFSLSMPRYWGADDLHTLPWLAAVSVPLLTSFAAVAYVQRLRPSDLGLSVPTWKGLLLQVGIGVTGIPLGFVEYVILRPHEWIASAALLPLVGGILVIFLATGLAEELIFRGILLRRAIESLGRNPGILFVTLVFSALHIFFRNAYDLTFVFLVGLFYAVAVFKTKSLWGAIWSHSLGNVMLYLAAPFLFGFHT